MCYLPLRCRLAEITVPPGDAQQFRSYPGFPTLDVTPINTIHTIQHHSYMIPTAPIL